MLTEVRCPLCRHLAPWESNPHRPFCSERCRLHDLGNWARERYRIPSPDAPGRSESEAETDEREE